MSQNIRRMTARFDGKCSVCGHRFPKGTEIWYSPVTKSVSHVDCTNAAQTEWAMRAKPKVTRRYTDDEDLWSFPAARREVYGGRR